MPDPIWIECEGSGSPVHGNPLYGSGICPMCGENVESNEGIAKLHLRRDILAMLERGDFDA